MGFALYNVLSQQITKKRKFFVSKIPFAQCHFMCAKIRKFKC